MQIQHAGKKDAYLLIRLPGLINHSVRDTCPIAIKNKGLPFSWSIFSLLPLSSKELSLV